MGIAEVERRAGTGRESLRRLADGRRSALRTSTGVILRLAQAARLPVERLLLAIDRTRTFRAERAERRRRTEDAIEAARRG
jgi:hypothetical protein